MNGVLNMAGEGTLGAVIRRLRRDRNLTQAQLAEKCGFANPMICDYEDGKNLPRKENLFKLAEALEVSPKILADVLRWERDARLNGTCKEAERFLASYLLSL